MSSIKHIILISGKRKCGKDYLSEKLHKRLSRNSCCIVRISEPIKSEWAKKLKLSLNDLLSDGPYKEKYRKDMIVWSDEVRSTDFGYFCRAAMENVDAEIVIVSDIRRKNDIRFFQENYGSAVKTVRLMSSEAVRTNRGFVFTVGVDDVASECDLDDYDKWDLELENNNQPLYNVLIKPQVSINVVKDAVASECDLDDNDKWDLEF